VADRVHQNPNLIFSVGTQVVTLRNITVEGGRILHPRGSVGVVVRSPGDLDHSYRVRFLDGIEEALRRDDLMMLAEYKEGEIGDSQVTAQRNNLFARVIYRCVIGSRAYGLEGDEIRIRCCSLRSAGRTCTASHPRIPTTICEAFICCLWRKSSV